MLEMVLLLPFLIVLFLGIVDFGRVYYATIEVTQAARAGAQYGAQNTTTANDLAGITTAARNAAPNLGPTPVAVLPTPPRYCLCSDGTSVSCSQRCPVGCTTGCVAPQVYVTVTTQFTFRTFAPYVPVYPFVGVPDIVDLRRTAVMRVQ